MSLISKYSAYRNLWASLAISELGGHFFEIAVAVYALNSAHGVLTLGALLAMATVPRMTLGWVVAGVIDRWHKQYMMIAADILRALVVLSLVFYRPLWWTLATIFIIQFFGMFFLPASRAILPETVPSGQLDRANSVIGTTISTLTLVGYGTASGVIAWGGVSTAFIINAASFVLSALFVSQIRLAPHMWRPDGFREAHFFKDLRDGITFHKETPVVFDLLWLSGLAVLSMFAINVLAGPIATHWLDQAPSFYGFLMLAIGVGTIIGAQIITYKGDVLSRRAWVAGGFGLMGVTYWVLNMGHSVELVMGAFVIMGVGNQVAQIPLRSWILDTTPLAFRGRVFAARNMVLAITGGISLASSGIVSQWLGLGTSLVVYGVIAVLAAVGVLVRPSLRISERKSPSAAEQG